MNYISVCSGIEAATVAWHPLGWSPVAFSEIEAFPSAVLAHHYPSTPNVGDMTKFKEWDFGSKTVDLLVGGTPCQSFSVAGLRKGLEDPRGNLALVYCGILDWFRPQWFVWENVPGVLSSSGGRDFGSFLGALVELGYGFSYRVLDAQYFGVAQRRRRVFVVGHLGDWRPAAKVLFEPESLRRDPAPSRETGKGFARTSGTLTANGGGLNRPAGNANELDFCIPAYGIPGNWIGRKPENGGNAVEPMHDVAPCLTKTDQHGVAHTLRAQYDASEDGTGRGTPIVPIAFNARQDPDHWHGRTGPLDTDGGTQAVAQPIPLDLRNAGRDPEKHDEQNRQGVGVGEPGDPSHTLTTACVHGVADRMAVRRLTPIECERLQGFPDGYTNVPWRKSNEAPDGSRYKALGNSMAVPVMNWIGRRIQAVEDSKI